MANSKRFDEKVKALLALEDAFDKVEKAGIRITLRNGDCVDYECLYTDDEQFKSERTWLAGLDLSDKFIQCMNCNRKTERRKRRVKCLDCLKTICYDCYCTGYRCNH